MRKFLLLLGREQNVSTHVCGNTMDSFDWLIQATNEKLRFKILQPITIRFYKATANASLINFMTSLLMT